MAADAKGVHSLQRSGGTLSTALTYVIGATGTCTTALLLLYLMAFERNSNERWSTPRTLAAYALGISLLVLFNGIIALLWRFVCCGQRATAADVHDGTALLPVVMPFV